MAYSINRFKSVIKELVRPNLFLVQVEPPPLFELFSLSVDEQIQLAANKALIDKYGFTYAQLFSLLAERNNLIAAGFSSVQQEIGGSTVNSAIWAEIVSAWVNGAAGDAVRDKELQMVCESAEFPGKTLATTQDTSAGAAYTLPYETIYNNITLTFLARKEMYERAFFDIWMEGIIGNGQPKNTSRLNNPILSAGQVNFYDNIVGSIKVVQLDTESNNVVTATLAEAYPIALSSMNLNWQENDTYQRFTVTFAYRYHNVDYDNFEINLE